MARTRHTSRKSSSNSKVNQRRIPRELERRADAQTRREAKAHGFDVTKRGVIVDGPRNKKREPIKGSRVRMLRGGVARITTGQRHDFVVGFTAEEKAAFARDPAAMEKNILDRMRARFAILRNKRNVEVRLQWGAYQATKEFTPTYFTPRYFAGISPEEIRREGKRRARPRLDKLTGFHFVVHVRKKKRKNAKRRKHH